MAKNHRSQQDSHHKYGLDHPCIPFSVADQIPLSHHGAVPLALVIDVAIQTRKATLLAIIIRVQSRMAIPPESVTTCQFPDLTILQLHYNLIFMACEKQYPDVLQSPNRDIAEKNLTHVAWRPASMVGGHCQEHRCQVVDTTRDVLEGTYKIKEFLKSVKRKKASYYIWPTGSKRL